MQEHLAASLWSKLDTKRSGVLQRARDCSALTIPHLLPPFGHKEDHELPTPYQGLGARGVNNLSSKLLLTLLPPNAPPLKFKVDDTDVVKLAGDEDLKANVEEGLAEVERVIVGDIEQSNTRTVFFEVCKHLVAIGDALLFQAPDGQCRMWKLDQYVVQRDFMGNVLRIIIKESVSPLTLDEETKLVCKITESSDEEKDVDVYTVIVTREGKQLVHQEINDIQVPDSVGEYPSDKPAYQPLRLSAVNGEDYGRGIVEEYLGDLRSLEGITKSVVTAAAASAKVIFMIDPNSSTRAKELAKAESGDIITGRRSDVEALQVEKYADLRVALEVSQEITQRLSHAFLLNTSVQRHAERVTAEEIRYMAQELEDALGGVYSVLTQELQLPFFMRRIFLLEKQKKLPPLPKDIVRPTITTGLEALGRGHDVSKLRAVLDDLSPLGPETISKYLNVPDYILRVVTARGVDSDGLIKTPQEIQQEEMQAMMQQISQQAGPGVIEQMMQGNQPQQG